MGKLKQGPESHLEGLAFADTRQQFVELANEWRRTRPRGANAHVAHNNPAYRKIIEMGRPALPFILEELRERPDFWFAALREISGENPVPPESRGKIGEMTECWIAWGSGKGHVRSA